MGGGSYRCFFFSPPASSESYCFIIHAMGANRPLASHRSLAVLTVHGTLRATDSVPPQSHPRSGNILRSSPQSSGKGPGTASARERCSLEAEWSKPAAFPACQPGESLLELSPIHVPATHSRPSFCLGSGGPDKREPLPARDSGASNKPVSTLTPLKLPGSHSTYLE